MFNKWKRRSSILAGTGLHSGKSPSGDWRMGCGPQSPRGEPWVEKAEGTVQEVNAARRQRDLGSWGFGRDSHQGSPYHDPNRPTFTSKPSPKHPHKTEPSLNLQFHQKLCQKERFTKSLTKQGFFCLKWPQFLRKNDIFRVVTCFHG